eukprot:TRINITY_DN3903_c0_g1_i1.p1 TRINITY_DN3903_c0_g1~~TRINITY_DN3903_c0_g1_i1.p1  ORF type:complete len:171 (-),score=53.66 TRINITY_DN3903_c0_g1_i1:37-528(-)
MIVTPKIEVGSVMPVLKELGFTYDMLFSHGYFIDTQVKTFVDEMEKKKRLEKTQELDVELITRADDAMSYSVLAQQKFMDSIDGLVQVFEETGEMKSEVLSLLEKEKERDVNRKEMVVNAKAQLQRDKEAYLEDINQRKAQIEEEFRQSVKEIEDNINAELEV